MTTNHDEPEKGFNAVSEDVEKASRTKPPVNIYIIMENHPFMAGYLNYFYGSLSIAMSVYQRVTVKSANMMLNNKNVSCSP